MSEETFLRTDKTKMEVRARGEGDGSKMGISRTVSFLVKIFGVTIKEARAAYDDFQSEDRAWVIDLMKD
jgi:hypothetical protein